MEGGEQRKGRNKRQWKKGRRGAMSKNENGREQGTMEGNNGKGEEIIKVNNRKKKNRENRLGKERKEYNGRN